MVLDSLKITGTKANKVIIIDINTACILAFKDKKGNYKSSRGKGDTNRIAYIHRTIEEGGFDTIF